MLIKSRVQIDKTQDTTTPQPQVPARFAFFIKPSFPPHCLTTMPDQITFSTTDITELCSRVRQNYNSKKQTNPNERYLISLAGAPGSGKTTFADTISQELSGFAKVIVLPQDGFHLYRSELLAMPDPEEAFRRRGAPFTFNAEAFVELVSNLSDRSTAIKAPSFDHKLKDPIEDDIVIEPEIDIVILEGNYVSLKDEHWNKIGGFVDDTWFIQTPEDLLRERLIKRHLEAGIASNEQEAIERAEGSDMDNGRYIIANSNPTNVVIVTK
ncbi:hypothetical protein Cantr_01188 [Candida viswanathii]|uniref:Phosphoribulokinase/uridine kinase domain-containing protein n=1 Tax=Candida viswanathii TaxID=5486 RepID=A0A367YJ34_9ASCO|nr:hypothetical protein Cantr_01188 [Candida viswanathii]